MGLVNFVVMRILTMKWQKPYFFTLCKFGRQRLKGGNRPIVFQNWPSLFRKVFSVNSSLILLFFHVQKATGSDKFNNVCLWTLLLIYIVK